MKLEIVVHLTILAQPPSNPRSQIRALSRAQPAEKKFTSWSQSEPISSVFSGTNSHSAELDERVAEIGTRAPAWAAAVVATTAATELTTAATELAPAAAPTAAARASTGLNLEAGLGVLNRGGGGDAADCQINTMRRGEGAYPAMRAMTRVLNCILKRMWVFV
jgi:hypothetical protein